MSAHGLGLHGSAQIPHVCPHCCHCCKKLSLTGAKLVVGGTAGCGGVTASCLFGGGRGGLSPGNWHLFPPDALDMQVFAGLYQAFIFLHRVSMYCWVKHGTISTHLAPTFPFMPWLRSFLHTLRCVNLHPYQGVHLGRLPLGSSSTQVLASVRLAALAGLSQFL